MKVPVPIRVYADFECINQPQNTEGALHTQSASGTEGALHTEGALRDTKVLFKQIPIAVGYYLISPFGNNY